LIFLLVGTLFVLRSSSWFVVWLGLEINMMGFIPYVGGRDGLVLGSIFKYFLVQVVGSIGLFFLGLFGRFYWGYWSFLYDGVFGGGVLLFVIILKMGMRPFHNWFISVSERVDWIRLVILITWQRLGPLGVVRVGGVRVELVVVCGLISVLVGSFGGLNELNLRRLIAYSSISHLGWLFFVFVFSSWVGLFYFFVYRLIVLGVIFYLFSSNFLFIGHFYLGFGLNLMMVGGFCLRLFSLGGLPPMLGFYCKWLGILSILSWGFYWLVVCFVFFGLVTLYFYVRVGYASFLGGGFLGSWVTGIGMVNYIGVGFGLISCFFLPLVIIFII
jgi:NADH:ubiquinone oxidoreductase subunit 2 (subunit N)